MSTPEPVPLRGGREEPEPARSSGGAPQPKQEGARRPTPAGEPPVLEVRGLTKRFPLAAEPALESVDLAVGRGETVALVGESGCGKTTLLRLIAGLDTPTRGSVSIEGRTVVAPGRWVPPERRGVGLVFQDYALFPHLRVEDNVAFGLTRGSRAARRERTHAMLALVGMAGYADRYPHELSGGQQQRVALARALAPEPAILLLDEPFSNLDVLLRARVREQVGEVLLRSGATALFVVHDSEDVLTIADRIAVLRCGRLQQVGDPEGVYRHPRNEYVARFFGKTNVIPGRPGRGGFRTPMGFLPARAQPGDARRPDEALPATVLLSVRPEDVEVEPTDGPGSTGIIRRCVFRGIYQELLITLPDAPELEGPITAHVPGDCRYHVGEIVRVRLRPGSAQVIGEA